MREWITLIENALARPIIFRLDEKDIHVPWGGNDYLTLSVGSTTLKYAVYRDRVDIVDLDTLIADRGKGQAKAAMNALIQKADEKKVGIRLLSYP